MTLPPSKPKQIPPAAGSPAYSEALLHAVKGKVVVVKLGGSTLRTPELKGALVSQVIGLRMAGCKIVVVHGGGHRVSEELKLRGVPAGKIQGFRVTSADAIKVVVAVLSAVNRELASVFESKSAAVYALDGVQKNILLSGKKLLVDEGARVDLGWVGSVERVDAAALKQPLNAGLIPVVAPIGKDRQGNFYNINADEAAFAVAAAVKAHSLVFLTDVSGVLKNIDNPLSRIPHISIEEAHELIGQGIISGGMLPKVRACVDGIQSGIRQIAILNGEVGQALLKALVAPQEVGTLISEVVR